MVNIKIANVDAPVIPTLFVCFELVLIDIHLSRGLKDGCFAYVCK